MMATITVGRMVTADLNRGYLETLENLSPLEGLTTGQAVNLFFRMIEDPNRIMLVASTPDLEVVGAVTILIEEKFIRGGRRVAHIEDVATRKGFEGQGIGRQLIEAAKEVGRQHKCRKAILDCSEMNKGFYEKLGFRATEIEMRYDYPIS